MSLLTWCLPGVNAMLVRWRRPDLVRNAPFGKQLPWIGLAWIVFPLWIYIFAVVKPIVNALTAGGALKYLETNGIIDAGLFYLIGLVDLLGHAVALALRGSRLQDALHRAAAGLRRRPAPMADTRIYVASDLHAAEKAWRKFINAIALNVYKADVALLAGDLTGKAIVPIVDRGEHRRDRPVRRQAHGAHRRGAGHAAARHRRCRLLLVRDHGGEASGCPMTSPARDELLGRLMNERVAAWMQLATERLADSKVPLYLIPGNDDEFGIDPILDQPGTRR